MAFENGPNAFVGKSGANLIATHGIFNFSEISKPNETVCEVATIKSFPFDAL